MKSVIISLLISFFSLSVSAQSANSGAKKAAVQNKTAKSNKTKAVAAKQTSLKSKKPSIVTTETVIDGEQITTLIHEQGYVAMSRFESMLQKRLQVDAAAKKEAQVEK